MELRVATLQDIPAMVAIGEKFIKESPTYSQRGYIPERAAAHFQAIINGAGVIFLAEENGQIIGGFVGGIITDWQSNHKMAFDYVMYVEPNNRGFGVARELADCFILWAKAMGADCIQCGTGTKVNTEHTVNLYKSLGFQQVGVFLELEI